jgi:hypothetical protein
MDEIFEFEGGFSPAGAGWHGEAEAMEEELRRGRGFAPRPVHAPFRGRFPPPGVRRPLPPRRPPVRIVRPYLPAPWPVFAEPYPAGADAPDTERVRWLQDCLNQAEGLRLPVTGIMDAATRSALRRFQRRSGLRPSGIAGPDTEDALMRACGGQPPAEPQQEGGLDAPPPPPRLGPPQPLATAARNAAGAGVYVLLKNKQPFYVGETDNLRRRLMEHLLCLTRMAVNPAPYSYAIALMDVTTTPERKRLQERLISRWRPNLTNGPSRELEEEMRSVGGFDTKSF